MWLLDTSNLELNEFTGGNIPRYAILFHTWGYAGEEVTFHDLREDRSAAILKVGYRKVKNFCLKCAQDGYQYAWVDTCCIDKRSSAELSGKNQFYVQMVSERTVNDDAFSRSRWFTRGWTLQELLAPRCVQFFGQDWTLIGIKQLSIESIKHAKAKEPLDDPFLMKLVRITGVREEVFQDRSAIRRASVAQRMSWAAQRQTTREEDIAYSMMGLFDIHMPVLYGEGRIKAFKRLQLEIIKSSLDQSIFAWRANRESSGLLAESPLDFADSGAFQPWNPTARDTTIVPYSMTNMGLSINLPIKEALDMPEVEFVLASLGCWLLLDGGHQRIQIYLRRIQWLKSKPTVYRRERCNVLELAGRSSQKAQRQDIYVLEEEQLDLVELIDNLYTRNARGLKGDCNGGGLSLTRCLG